jgi:nitrite reductase/ring-hydroxylating ferredoxin subunit
MTLQAIIHKDALREGKSVKFKYQHNGKYKSGFMALIEGHIVAYENRCQHLPVPLDYCDNQFMSKDGKHFVCRSHGALFDPQTGRCVRGPCEDAKLNPLPIAIVNDQLCLELEN